MMGAWKWTIGAEKSSLHMFVAEGNSRDKRFPVVVRWNFDWELTSVVDVDLAGAL
jgi:hypothetical protein